MSDKDNKNLFDDFGSNYSSTQTSSSDFSFGENIFGDSSSSSKSPDFSSNFGSSFDNSSFSSSSSSTSSSNIDLESFLNGNTDLSGNTDSDRNQPKRSETKDAKTILSRTEYLKRLSELNKDAEHKNYVLIFGSPNTGKTFFMSNIINYAMSKLNANVRLAVTASSESQQLFNQFLESYNNPYAEKYKLARTSTTEIFEFPVEIEPKNRKKPTVEFTFVDVSGENFEKAYKSPLGADDYRGEIPDSVRVILDSYVNKFFLFLWDPTFDTKENAERAPQVGVIQAFFDQICSIQNRNGQNYNKLLIISKSDLIPEKIKAQYGYDSRLFLEDSTVTERRAISTFTKNFFSENEHTNSCIFYSAGKNVGDMFEENHESAEKVFKWLYQRATGVSIVDRPTFGDRLRRWFAGE
ncbi:hypothetical protein CKF54_04125 [Psittacicella hinzii]|uniref:Uncharacterized protein n=1 Tax=Psittacicella hinzii TaxID=2028575 RepID=A0A3A1Y9U1_9GAMM|nr:hypothetical protein [Psittacicella hinzii]RIY32887.1 hypothetical protein CKF54_04125 [Psittacicella hinzii]